jgi:addiction module HigA family antidote
MINSYRTKQTARFVEGERVKEFEGIARQARRRLALLNAATSLSVLAAIPGNRLEVLTGDRAGQHSIRINRHGAYVSSGMKQISVPKWWRSSIITKGYKAEFRLVVHPGEILGDELEELGVSARELARQINVPANRITQIVKGQRGITGDTALRLGHWFGTGPQLWLNLQSTYELNLARKRAGKEVERLPLLERRPEAG